MCISRSLEEIGAQTGAGALIGYTIGWGLKKLLKIIIKLAAIVLAAFFGGLFWLQVQRIVTVDWNELENKSRHSQTPQSGSSSTVTTHLKKVELM